MKNRINANPCFKIFSDQKKFDKHVKAVHNISSPSLSANFESESNAVDGKNENHNIKSRVEYNSNDTMMNELATFTADRSNA